jgi:uncharacterized protein (DUF849 family)
MPANKVVLTCAVTGGSPFNRRHPNFPITPEQIADAALEAQAAGASVVHLHVRDPATGEGTRSPRLFRELVAELKTRNLRAILNLTCGGGANYIPDLDNDGIAAPQSDVGTADDRTTHIRENRPEMCSLDVTTQNQMDGEVELVYLHSQRTLRKMATIMRDHDVKPELEVFAPGDVLFANQMIAEGLLEAPYVFQFVLGTRWGLPSDVETLLYMRRLLPPGAVWGAFGIGKMQMPMVAQVALLGGNVRVGLEDNLYLSRGKFATNGELVGRAVSILHAIGCEVASPDEARQSLGLNHQLSAGALFDASFTEYSGM